MSIVCNLRWNWKQDEVVTPKERHQKTSSGSGVFITEFNYKEVIKLDDDCSVLQAKLVAI